MPKLYLSAEGAESQFDSTCPYPGLRPFEEADAALFFGRRRLVEELITQLEFQPLVILLGSSGCGKSSVARAGVIPRWREKYPGGKVVLARPGTNPFEGLAEALDEFPESLATAVRQPGSQIFRQLRAAAPHVLLVIDPFENLFVGTSETQAELRKPFLNSLVDLARTPDSGIQVLLAMRDDFVAHLRGHDEFYRIADNSLQRITSLKGEGLRESMEAPARARGVRFEDGLAADLERQVEAHDGMLPHLQDALATWWREEDLNGRVLRRDTLDGIGGWSGALPQRLDRWFQSLSPSDQAAAQPLLLSLVDWSATPEWSPPVLRSVPRSRLVAASSASLVDDLANRQRLLIRRGLASPSDPVLELSHECVLQAWPLFGSWMERVHDAAPILQRLRDDARRWSSAQGREKRDLRWKGYPLDQALIRQQRGDYQHLGGLAPLEADFLRACARARTLRSVRDHVLGVAAGVVAVISLAAAFLATAKFREADSQKHAAEIKAGLGWLARAETAEGSTDAGFFAAIATGFDGAGREHPSAENPSAAPSFPFFPSRQRDRYPRYLTLQDAPARKIEADRRMFSAPKPFLWSAPFDRNSGAVQSVALSLDGRQLASTGSEGRVYLWSVATGTQVRVLDGSTSPVQDLDFSPPGNLLATGHADGSLILWDAGTGQKTASFQGHTAPVRAVAFSPAGTQVASAGEDGAIKIWGVETAGETRTLAGHSGPVLALAFGPGGILLASGGNDRFVRVWNVATGEEANILTGHINPVEALAFSPDGCELASASRDQPVLLWDLETHKSISNLPLPGTFVHGLAFSPDGGHLAIAANDGRLRIWTLGQERSTRVLSGHSAAIRTVAFSPDGKLVATGSEDRTVKLWAVRDAWKGPAQPATQPGTGGQPARSAPPSSDGFNWFRYVGGGWVRLDEHSSALLWKQLPQGLPFSDSSLPPHSWIGILRSHSGEEQTRRLLTLALEARNWDAAALLQTTLPSESASAVSPDLEFTSSAALRLLVQDDLKKGQTALAEWRMQRGDIIFPRNQEWSALRAGYLEGKGDPQSALVFYRRMDRLEGWKAVARLSPDGKEAVEAWLRVLRGEKQTNPLPYLSAGKRAAEAKELSAVQEIFGAGIQQFPGDRALRLEFARELVGLGALDEALAQFEVLAPGEGDLDQTLMALLKESNCLAPVLSLLSERAAALKKSGSGTAALEAMQKLARFHLAAGQVEEAVLVLKERIGYLQQAGDQGPLNRALDDLAKTLMGAGRRDEAFTVMRARIDILKAQPPGAELAAALLELQTALLSAGLSVEGIGVLQERITIHKGQAGFPVSDLLADLAAALQKAGRQEEAFVALKERAAAIQAEGKDPVPALRDWAEALQTAGKSAEAWTAYRSIGRLPHATVPLIAEVAYWGALHGQREEAMILFDEAANRAAHDADRALVGRLRGWALLDAGSFENAFRVLGMAKAQLESSPETAKLIESDLLSGLAAAFWMTGRKGASLDEYETLWQQQKANEHWELADFIRSRVISEVGRKALLELHAVWYERMHKARTARP